MARIPLLLRALVCVPLLALAADLARASLACGPRAETCLEAAGQGWMGGAGTVALVLYALGPAFGIARLARGAAPVRRWLLCSAGVAAVCGGQAALAAALGDPALLGGGWPELAGFCLAAGALLALALALAPAVAALARTLNPPAPRLPGPAAASVRIPAAAPRVRRVLHGLAPPGRGPPAPA